MQRRRFTLWLAASIAVAAFGTPSFAQPQATVAAASDLKFALEEVSARFEHDTGQKIRLVFGSSGNFYSQIVQGAPFHVFMSADEAFVFKLAEAGKTVDRGRLYAVGRIGIIVPKGSSLKPDGELVDLAAALK
ncbi:molybdate ABC transporter substrate-binding protein, partial [Shigella sp. SHS-5]